MYQKIKSYFIEDALRNTADPFRRSQIELTFQLILIWILLFSLLIVSYAPLPVNADFMAIHCIVLVCIIIALPIFKITQSHRIASFIIIGQMWFVNTLMLFYFHGMQTAESSLWYMLIIISSFMLLGRFWGWVTGIYYLVLLMTALTNGIYNWGLFDVGLEVGMDITSDPVSHAIPMLINIYSLSHFIAATNRAKNIISSQKVEIERAHHNIKDSINYARRIQTAILPTEKRMKTYLPQSFVLYKPKDVVSGDFYWIEPTSDAVLFAVADCTGHGVPGAMVSVICNGALHRAVREFALQVPGDILNKTRDLIVQEFEKSEDEVKDGMDIALCLLKGRELQYAGANNPLWIVRNGEILETKGDKQPIGKTDDPQPFTTHTLTLQQGDLIYIFSDGFVDQFGGEHGKKYMSKQLKTTLLQFHNLPLQEQMTHLHTAFEQWKGDTEQIDDVCLIGVKVV